MMSPKEGRAHSAWDFLTYRITRSDPVLGPALADILRGWLAIRREKALPARGDLDPRSLGASLGHAFILDRARPGTIRLRVAGYHMNDLMGMEVRGMPVRAFFTLTERRRMMALMERVFTTPAVLDLSLVSVAEGTAPLTGRMLVLPMTDDLGHVTKALGCLVTKGCIGQSPRRFAIRSYNVTDPSNGTMLRDLEPSGAPSGFTEPAYEFAHPAKKADLHPPHQFSPGPVPWLKILQT
jgi:hypothetical protein